MSDRIPPTEPLPEFTPLVKKPRTSSPRTPGWSEQRTGEQRSNEIDRLVPLARELAEKAGAAGVRMENVRLAAVQRGILTGEESNLDYLGAVGKRAGLVNSGRRHERNEVIRKTHGNLGVVWVLPQYAQRKEGAA